MLTKNRQELADESNPSKTSIEQKSISIALLNEECSKFLNNFPKLPHEITGSQSKQKSTNTLGKMYKSKIVHYINILRENYFGNQINLINKNNPIRQWELLGLFSKTYKNKVTIDTKKLNDNFVYIGHDLTSEIPFPKTVSKTKISPNSIYFEPICTEEIKSTTLIH